MDLKKMVKTGARFVYVQLGLVGVSLLIAGMVLWDYLTRVGEYIS